jgi:uncharacterized iron-regulated protein
MNTPFRPFNNNKSRVLAISALALFFSAATSAAPPQAATISFGDVDQYREMPHSQSDRRDVMAEFQRHFDKLAAKLPSGQTLKVDIRDVSLAGRYASYAAVLIGPR